MTTLMWPAAIVMILAAPCVGSFAGLVINRLPVGRPVLFGRSACTGCGRTLALRDLVPVAGWLANRGHCRYCARPISALYPVLEAAAVLVAIWSLLVVPGWLAFVTFGLGAVLIMAAAIDWRHKLLPDGLTLPLIPAGLATHLLLAPENLVHSAGGAVAGYAIIYVVRGAYRRVRRREGIGLGDAKLLAAAGAWVTWQGLPSVLLLAAGAGLLVGAGGAIYRSRLALQEAVAFGPFLAGAFWLVWLYGPLQLG